MDDEHIWAHYRRTQIAEMTPWYPGLDMAGISVSPVERDDGSPKDGDMIARNPANHADKWLVAAKYFDDNFEPIWENHMTTITRSEIDDLMRQQQEAEERQKRASNVGAYNPAKVAEILAADAASPELTFSNADDALNYLIVLPASTTEAPPKEETDELENLVDRFSKRLLAKLKLARANGRGGWERDDWEEQCQQGLLKHLEKGDPRDVAAYCAFMDHHGWITKAATPPASTTDRDATIEECARLADGWITVHGETEIEYTTAREYAVDAVQDVADAIRALSRSTLASTTEREALIRARAHIVTLGGGYNGSAYGDKIHAAVLDQIDAALSRSTKEEVTK